MGQRLKELVQESNSFAKTTGEVNQGEGIKRFNSSEGFGSSKDPNSLSFDNTNPMYAELQQAYDGHVTLNPEEEAQRREKFFERIEKRIGTGGVPQQYEYWDKKLSKSNTVAYVGEQTAGNIINKIIDLFR